VAGGSSLHETGRTSKNRKEEEKIRENVRKQLPERIDDPSVRVGMPQNRWASKNSEKRNRCSEAAPMGFKTSKKAVNNGPRHLGTRLLDTCPSDI
jgi:hypothetical protein